MRRKNNPRLTSFVKGAVFAVLFLVPAFAQYTPGSVIFAGSTGSLSQNNSEFFWDNANTRLEIGLNSSATAYKFEISDFGPPWTSSSFNTIYDSARIVVSGFPLSGEWGNDTSAIAQALVGALSIPSDVTSNWKQGTGVAGYAQSAATNAPGAVGVYGQGNLAGVNGAWGANFATANYTSNNTSAGIAGNLWGVEIDVNTAPSGSGSSAPANAWGETVVSAAYAAPSGDFDGVLIQRALTSQMPFNYGFRTQGGSASVAFQAGPTHETLSNRASQPIQLVSRNASGNLVTSQLVEDPAGDLTIASGPGAIVYLTDTSSPANVYLYAQPGLVTIADSNALQIGFVSALPSTAANGTLVYCSNCTPGACSTSGSGALAVHEAGNWKCF